MVKALTGASSREAFSKCFCLTTIPDLHCVIRREKVKMKHALGEESVNPTQLLVHLSSREVTTAKPVDATLQ